MKTRVRGGNRARGPAYAAAFAAAALLVSASPAHALPGATDTLAVETAGVWVQAFNSWEGSHGAPDRIVASIDRGDSGGIRVVEVEIAQRTSTGIVKICGWFAVRERELRNPGHQIAGSGREACVGLEGAA
jgi:hypothetical protein